MRYRIATEEQRASPTRLPSLCRLRCLLTVVLLSFAVIASAQYSSAPRGFGRGSIEAAVLSPDGRRLISSGSDGLYIYDAGSLEDVAHLQRAVLPRYHVPPLFSPDGRLLAMGYADTAVVIWDMETLSEVAALTGHGDWITALAFSADGSRLASGDRAGDMRVWSTADWSLLANGRSEFVRALTFQGLDRLVASNGFRAIRIWRLPDFVETGLLVHEDNVRLLHMFSDQRRLLSGASDGTARLWDLDTGEALAILPQPGNYTAGIMVSPDERFVVLYNSSSSYAGTHVWRLDPLEEIASFTWPDAGPLGISGDSRKLLIWSRRDDDDISLVRTWNLNSGRFTDSLRVDLSGYTAFDADALQLTMLSTAGHIARYDLSTGDVLRRPLVYMQHVEDVAFSPGGQWLAAAFSRYVHIWDVATESALLTINTESSVDRIGFSDDCGNLYIKNRDGLQRRRLNDLSRAFTVYDGHITELDFALGAERAALGWRQGHAAVLDLRRNTTAATFEGHPAGLSTVGLSADGSLLAISGEWRDVAEFWLWRVSTGTLLGRLPARRAGVTSFDFSPDSRLLAASGWYDGLQLWDTETLTLVDTIATASRVKALAFSPDGQTLAWSDAVPAPLQLRDIPSGRQSAAAAGSVPFAGEVLAFSPAQSIAVGGWAGRVWLWDADQPLSPTGPSPCADIGLNYPPPGQDSLVTEPEAEVPTALALYPARPNPVIDHTVITFDVPVRAQVQLEIYNLQGQLVRRLVDEELTPDRYLRPWNGLDDVGRPVASGVYLVRLRIGRWTGHSKLLKLR